MLMWTRLYLDLTMASMCSCGGQIRQLHVHWSWLLDILIDIYMYTFNECAAEVKHGS